MIANITKDGELEIIPENGVEHYALMKWFEDYIIDPNKAPIHVKLEEK